MQHYDNNKKIKKNNNTIAILEWLNDEVEYKNTADMISSLNIAKEAESKNQHIQQQGRAPKGIFFFLL